MQSRLVIIKEMLTKKYHHKYSYHELNKVAIELNFTTTSGGYSGLWRTYVIKFIFYFKDSFEYSINGGESFEEQLHRAYQILKNKNINLEIQAEVEGYLLQKQKSVYEYFEDIYQLNSVKKD